jgi:hypothetical protein
MCRAVLPGFRRGGATGWTGIPGQRVEVRQIVYAATSSAVFNSVAISRRSGCASA